MKNPPLRIPFDPALSLVREECRKATENGYLEPYVELQRAALSLARQLIELQKSTRVPFSEADACWCQPFDGPVHPNCPMHGDPK